MLLIDELYEIKKLSSAIGVVNVKKDSFFVQGHLNRRRKAPSVHDWDLAKDQIPMNPGRDREQKIQL